MNAMTAPVARPSSAITALRTVLAAGGWSNGLLVLGWVLAAVFSLLGAGEDKAVNLAPVMAAMLVMFWSMLGGSRLIALAVQASRVRLPGIRRQVLQHGIVVVALTVGVPFLLLAMTGSPNLSVDLAVLCLGLLTGLFWASMPPWLTIALIGVVYLPFWLLSWFGATWRPTPTVGQVLATMAVLLLVGNAWCWWRMARRDYPGNGWQTPIALAFANGLPQSMLRTQQAQYSSALFTQDTPIGDDLHRHPEQALGIALGPGFGGFTFKGLLGSLGPILAVALFWLLLQQANEEGPAIALFFAPMLAISPALAPMMRLQTLLRLPALGLHELALLPGLSRPAAPALIRLLARQTLLRTLPALAIMVATGYLMHAQKPFYPLLLWSTCASLLWLQGLGLLALHSRPMRWALGSMAMLLIVAIFASMFGGLRGQQPLAWVLPAWQAASVAGALLLGIACLRLRALPHPWLQN